MPLLVVGSIAIDVVETPHGSSGEALGGSATFFSYAASFFSPVRVVGIVGQDFPPAFREVFDSRPQIDARGVTAVAGKTFRWHGRYHQNLNSRETLEVQLNCFGTFDPDIPSDYRDSQLVFLANASPVVQRKVLHQVKQPRLVVCDTMDLWIETQRPDLLDLLKQVDGVLLNDQEALLLTGRDQLIDAGRAVLDLGPKFVIVKKGEHGSMLFSQSGVTSLPAYPVEKVVDPTGAGDSFAGGLMGYLATSDDHDHNAFRRGLAYATVLASIGVEDFSLRRFERSSREEIEQRYQHYRDMLRVE